MCSVTSSFSLAKSFPRLSRGPRKAKSSPRGAPAAPNAGFPMPPPATMMEPWWLKNRRWRRRHGICHAWLVVWNMNFIFPNSWDDDPIWRTHIFQRGRSTTNQSWSYVGLSFPPDLFFFNFIGCLTKWWFIFGEQWMNQQNQLMVYSLAVWLNQWLME